MNDSAVAKVCAICGATNAAASAAPCTTCGVDFPADPDGMMVLETMDLDFRPRKPAHAASTRTAKSSGSTLREAIREAVSMGLLCAAAAGLAVSCVLLLVNTIASTGVTSIGNALLTGLGIGVLVGFSGGAIWKLVRSMGLGVLGGVAAGAVAGIIIALTHQLMEQVLIFSTSEVPLASTAIMGAAGGGICGLFIAWLNSE